MQGLDMEGIIYSILMEVLHYRPSHTSKMDEEEEWEKLDENAMEECMILATQLCSQQPQGGAAGGQNSTHTHTAPHSRWELGVTRR